MEFFWTDDKLQLLLQAALDYKGKWECNAKKWETKCQKYKDIFNILMKEYLDEKGKHPNKEKLNKEQRMSCCKVYKYTK